MPELGKDDPEMAYRRGYQDGATQTFRAAERFLDPITRAAVRSWIDTDIYECRFKAMLAEPPTWRLTMLESSSTTER